MYYKVLLSTTNIYRHIHAIHHDDHKTSFKTVYTTIKFHLIFNKENKFSKDVISAQTKWKIVETLWS